MEELIKQESSNEGFENWIKSNLKDEVGELDRVFQMVYGKTILNNKKMIDFIISEYSQSPLTALSADMWSKLENTDSHDFEVGQIETMGKMMDSAGRDWQRIKKGYENNEPIPAPIVCKLPDGKFHLTAGNTRLSVARVLGEVPKVVIMELPESFE